MTDLTKTFLQCLHCGHHFMEPRHVCPACDWPRAHTDVTPGPETSRPDPNAYVPPAQPALPVVGEHRADAELAAPQPIPQALAQILADIPVATPKRTRK